ncbi:MAG: TPM domain-containing protein [Ruminococcaceae bacterium]|nr:TPM domain-containing protein [Oscillospiraceae bacterium]
MKNKIFALIFALVFCFSSVCTVFAARDSVLLVDNDDLLTSFEEDEILEMLEDVSSKHDMDIVIVTEYSLGDKSAMEFADDYYDYNGYKKDGILLLVSTEYSDWHVSTTGYGITAITDAGLEHMSDRFVPYMSEGDFYTAFITFVELSDEFIAQAKSGDPYDIHNLPKAPFEFGISLIISLVIAFVIALIATGVMRGKLKTVRSSYEANDYLKEGSLDVTRSQDIFLYVDLKCRPRPKSDESGGGGSSTHFSSSGTSHGGGGGKF